MDGWRIAPKGVTSDRPGKLPGVTVRKMAIAYNRHLRDAAKLDDFQRVTIRLDDAEMRVALHFHNDENDENSYAVHFDGGGGSRSAADPGRKQRIYATQCQNVLKSVPWLKKISRLKDANHRRFTARFDQRLGWWIIQMRPSFDRTVTTQDQVPSELTGIYRYIHKDEVVYIGRGLLRQRLRVSEREDWDFDRIEYSIIDDKSQRKRWESEWLNLHEKAHGKLPRYNRVAGERIENDEED